MFSNIKSGGVVAKVGKMMLSQRGANRVLVILLAMGSIGLLPTRANSQSAQVPVDLITGQLDENSQTVDGGRYLTAHPYKGTVGEIITFEAVSEDFDPVIVLMSPNDEVLGWDDDSGSGANAQFMIELPETGVYWINVTSFSSGETGQYTLSWNTAFTVDQISQQASQFNQQSVAPDSATGLPIESNHALDDAFLEQAQEYLESGIITPRQLQAYIESGASYEQILERLEELKKLEERAISLQSLRNEGFDRGEGYVYSGSCFDRACQAISLITSFVNLFRTSNNRGIEQEFSRSRYLGLRALIGRGEVLNEQGEFKAAETTFRVALQLDPTAVRELREQERLDSSELVKFRNAVRAELRNSLGRPEVYAGLPGRFSPPWYKDIVDPDKEHGFDTYHEILRYMHEGFPGHEEAVIVPFYPELRVSLNLPELSSPSPPWYADVERELGSDPYHAFIKGEVYSDAYYTFGPYYAEIERYFGLGDYYTPLRREFLEPYYVVARIGLGTALNGQGRFEEAEAAFQTVLDLVPGDTIALIGLWRALNGQGRFEEAEAAYREALHPAPDDAAAYISLGTVLNEQERFEEAEAAHWEALRLSAADYAAYTGLGIALSAQKRFEEAASAFQESRRLMPHNSNADYSIKALREIVSASRGTLRLGLDHAEFLGIENIGVDNSSSNSVGNSAADNPLLQQANQLTQQAFELHKQGRYSEADPLLIDALKIRSEQLGEHHLDVAFSLNNLGVLYQHQGRDSEAEAHYMEALAILRKQLESHPDVATCLSNLAELYKSQGRYSEASPLYNEALQIRYTILGKSHFQVAASYHSLAGIHHIRGRYSEAESIYNLALDIRREQLGEDHLSVAFSHNGLGRLYQDQGRYNEAEGHLHQALEIFREQLGERHPFVANSVNNLVSLYQAKGDTAQIPPNLQAGLNIEEWNLEITLPTLAEIHRQAYTAQLSNTTNSAVSLHLQAAPNSKEASQLAFTTLLRRKGRILDAGASSLQVLRQNLTPEDQAILDQLTEVYRKLTTFAFTIPTSSSLEQYQTDLTQLETEATQLETTLARRSAIFRTASEPIEIASIQAQIPANSVLIEYVRYRPFDSKNVVTRFGPPRYAAYLLFPNGHIEAVDLGAAVEIDAAVQALKRLLKDPRTDLQGPTITEEGKPEWIEAVTDAIKIKTLVFDPIAHYLEDQQHLLISPDGHLNHLPFEALQTEIGGDYLVQRYQISYLNSGRDLLKFNLTEPSSTPALILANPNYDHANGTVQIAQTSSNTQEGSRSANRRSTGLSLLRFDSLPGTDAEAEAIHRLLPNAIVLTEAQATENALKTVQAPHILHIATHGFFWPNVEQSNPNNRSLGILATEGARFSHHPAGVTVENPLLRSGLALAGFNARKSGSEDGVLTALEASNLNLFGTQLVVLSACETGLGDIANGEGVYGLRRAFAIAGAETQLMSLWHVSDFGTQSLMEKYYEKLVTGMGRSEALRKTQLEMIADEEEQYSHPYYWAAFILAGNWRPLEEAF